MDVGGCIWVWVDVGGVLGGLEEDWRRVAGALEEPWRRMDPRSMAWVRPSMGIMSRPLGKMTFFAKMMFFDNFSFRALKLLANHEEQLLTFFGFLPPYFGVSRSLA